MRISLDHLVIAASLYQDTLVVALASGNQLFFQASGPSQAQATLFTADFTEVIQDIVHAYQIPGLSLAVVHKDGPPEVGTWGVKSEDGTSMTADTLFNIGSCSKAFLSASLGILIDDFAQGRNTTPLPTVTGLSSLSWKTKLSDILSSDWELSDPWASQKANLVDILSHVSGMPSHDLSYKRNDSALDITRNLRNLRPSRELREKFLYNNQMYVVGAQVVTALSGVRFVDFVKDRIFAPLNMTQTTYSVHEALGSGEASETWTPFGRRIPLWMEGVHAETVAGPGGVISNVNDLSSWVKLLLHGGVLDPVTNATVVISRDTLGELISAHSIVDGNPRDGPVRSIIGYGLGWTRFSYIGHDFLLHPGNAPGASAVVSALVSDGIGIVALANADGMQPALIEITFAIARKLLDLDELQQQQPDNTSRPQHPPAAHNASESAIHHHHHHHHHHLINGRQRDAREGEDHTQDAKHPTTTTSSRSRPLLRQRVDLVGTYHDVGYGPIELCSSSSRHWQSDACRHVLHDFDLLDEAAQPSMTHEDALLLFASWPSVFTTHARFVPIDEDLTSTAGRRYLVDFGTLYPTGYGRNKTPFTHWIFRVIADFVVEDGQVKGFGLSGIGERQGYGSVEENSDVWFTKCGS